MSKIMLINVTHAEESRVGIVENGQLESFEIESFSREHLKGNIYKGIVRRIHPAIEAAFVDIGAERDAFLPLDEICFRNLPAGRNGASGDKGRRRIKDVLKSGDEVLVQIIKEQFTNKPPTLSTFYSLPGRYLVLLPGSEDAGISRKIEGEERIRVREMIERLHPPPGCGIIVRTAAGFDEEQGELERDLVYLQRLWESIRKHAETKRAPSLIYREHDLVLRNIRDYFTPDINEIFIDNDEVFERAKDFLHNVMPGKEHLLHLYHGEQPIFSRFGLEAQIESIYKRRVQLRSGGSIVIDGTEALTAIDVNSGGSMRGASQEETAFKTNLEAAAEIARQLRLRDLGGIVVIDFIDMRQQSHVAEVERTLRDAMRPDKARHDIGRISRLGLLEVSRQRLRPAAAASSYTACPMCEGHGAVRTTESAALVALRKVHNRVAEGDVAQMRVTLPRDVAMYLLNQKRDDLAVLETRYGATITVLVSERLMPHQSEIETRTRELTERLVPSLKPGEVAALEAGAPINGTGGRGAARPSEMRAGAATPAASRRQPSHVTRDDDGERADGDGRGKRRRRRGGRGRRAGELAPAEQTSAAERSSSDRPSGFADDTEDAGSGVPSPAGAPLATATSAAWTDTDEAAGAAGIAHDTERVPPSSEPPFAAAHDPWSGALPAVADDRASGAELHGRSDDGGADAAPSIAGGPAQRADTPGAGSAETEGAASAAFGGYDAPQPSDPGAGTSADQSGAESASRRRRRRGGRRGGRGRRGAAAVQENGAPASPVSAGPGAPVETSDAAPGVGEYAGGDVEAGAFPGEPAARRRRSGATRRRRHRLRQTTGETAPADT